MIKLLIKLIFILIYQLNESYGLKSSDCSSSPMSFKRSEAIFNDRDRNLIINEKNKLEILDYSFKKSSLKLDVNSRLKIKNKLNFQFDFGLRLIDNLILEGIESQVSLIVLSIAKADLKLKRFQFNKKNCFKSIKIEANEVSSDAIKEEDEIASFLYEFCEILNDNSNLFVLKRDLDEFMILQVNANKKDAVFTISQIKNNLNKSYVNVNYILSENTSKGGVVSSKDKIYKRHSIRKDEIKLPEKLRDYLNRIVYFLDDDQNDYLIAIENEVTYIYEDSAKFFLNAIKQLINKKVVEDLKLPNKLTDYFPNNYWFECSIDVCSYADADLILNINPNGEADLLFLKNQFFFSMKLKENAVSNRPISKLAIKYSGEIRAFLNNLILNSHELDKDILEEFQNLKNVDAGDYLKLDDEKDLLFIIKGDYVYQLFTIRKNGKSVDQKLARSDLENFFSVSISKLYIQSIFTFPSEKRLILMTSSYTLLEYSYLNYVKGGMEEIKSSLEIRYSFKHVSASFTFRNYTYIFTKEHYQVFHILDYITNFYENTSGKTDDNFIDCPRSDRRLFEILPKLVIYSWNSRNAGKEPDVALASLSDKPNLSFKFIAQVIIVIIAISILIFIALSFLKFKHKIKFVFKKDESSSNKKLSTAFDFAIDNSSSEKIYTQLKSEIKANPELALRSGFKYRFNHSKTNFHQPNRKRFKHSFSGTLLKYQTSNLDRMIREQKLKKLQSPSKVTLRTHSSSKRPRKREDSY